MRTARRIAAAAAFGGGGLTLAGVTGLGLLAAEAIAARRWIKPRTMVAPDADGRYEPPPGSAADTSRPLRLAVLGDSGAVGMGASSPATTPGALLAARLAQDSGRPVDVDVLALVGAVSADLTEQVDRLEEFADDGRPADAVVVLVGGNDVKHRIPAHISVRQLSEAVARLRALGTQVVVGTCPDLGTVRPISQPLRTLVRRWSRRLAAAQAIAVVEAGGRAVSIGDLLGPEFETQWELMFSQDRFHPSDAGYARAVDYLYPALAAALGVLPADLDSADDGDVDRIDLVAGVGDAAVAAADNPGTQVSAITVGGAERGARGRWVRIRRGAPRA